MAANPLHPSRMGKSHSIALLARLLTLGIVRSGTVNWVKVWHDSGCPALASGSDLDCRCNPEVELANGLYLYSDFFGPDVNQPGLEIDDAVRERGGVQ